MQTSLSPCIFHFNDFIRINLIQIRIRDLATATWGFGLCFWKLIFPWPLEYILMIFRKYFKNPKMAKTAPSPTPRSVILRRVQLRVVGYCYESDCAQYNTARSSTPCSLQHSPNIRFHVTVAILMGTKQPFYDISRPLSILTNLIWPVLWIQNDLFQIQIRIRIQLWIIWVPDPGKSSGSMRIRIWIQPM